MRVPGSWIVPTPSYKVSHKNPPFSGAVYTDAVVFMDCAWCNAAIGEPCRTPGGRKTRYPHVERTTALTNRYGVAPWRRTR